MVSSKASTVAEYLDSLPPDRRAEIEKVREVVNRNIAPGFEEGMHFGMIGWAVPLSRLAETYNGQPLGIAGLAAQKNANSLYLMSVYGDPRTDRWFRDAWKQTGKKLDMGKSCIRFDRAEDLALDVIAQAVARVSVDDLVAFYREARARRSKTAAKKKPPAKKKPAKKKPAKKKPAKKKPAKKRR